MADAFAALLSQLLANDNGVRRAAENQYFQAVAAAPQLIILALLNALSTSPDEGHKSLSAVLLRRVVSSTADVWTKVSPSTLQSARQQLLAALQSEPLGHIRHKIAHAVTEVAITSAGKGCDAWPELLPALAALTQHTDAPRRASAVYLFARMCEYGGAELIAPRASMFVAILPAILQDASPEVRVHALDGCVFLILSLPTDSDRAVLQPLLPVMLNVLSACLTTDEAAAADCLKSLVMLLQDHPMFFRPVIEQAATAMLHIANMDINTSVRTLAMEFITSIAEVAGATLRKMPAVIEAITRTCIGFLTRVNDDPSWVTKMDNEGAFIGDEAGEEDEELVSQASSTLDRVALGVRGKAFWPLLSNVTGAMLQSADWKHRRAAMLSLALCVEGCKSVVVPQLRAVVQIILPFVNDPHPRVRHATLRCISQFINDMWDPYASHGDDGLAVNPLAVTSGHTIGDRPAKKKDRLKGTIDAAGDLILPVVIPVLQGGPTSVPRIRSSALHVLQNYTLLDRCNQPEMLHGCERAMLEGAVSVLRDIVEPSVRISAITLLGNVAQVLDEGFVTYYSSVMPLLQAVTESASGAGHALLRGRALEAMGMIAEAVGREVAGLHAAEVLNRILQSAKNGFLNVDADSFEVMMQALVRFANCLQADFVPYLAIVLPMLAAAATRDVKTAQVDTDDTSDAARESLQGLAAVPVRVKGVKNRTIAVDAGALATRFAATMALSNMVDELGVDVPGFWPYIEDVTKIMIANLELQFGAIRDTACATLVSCMRCALADVTNPAKAQKVFDACFNNLLAAAVEERDADILYTQGEALSMLMRISYESLSDGYGVDSAMPMTGSAGSPPFGSPGMVPPTASGCARAADGTSLHCKVSLNLSSVAPVLEAVQSMLQRSHEDRRLAIISSYSSNVDADAEHVEALEQELDEEDTFMSHLADVTGYIIKTHRAAILPAVTPVLLPYLLRYLPSTERWETPLTLTALCLVDDLIEWASPDAHQLLPTAFPIMLQLAAHTRPVMRQAAVYGLGVVAQHAPAFATQHASAIVARLGAVIQAPDARSDDNENCTDNAVAALYKVARFLSSAPGVDSRGFVSAILAYLPLRSDGLEAQVLHGSIVDALIKQDEFWLGSGMSNVPQVMRVLADALIQHKINTEDAVDDEEEDTGEQLFTPAAMDQLIALFQGIKGNAAVAPTMTAIVRSLKPKQQAALVNAGLAL